MSILAWLRRVMSGEHGPDTPMSFDDGEEHFCGLDMKQAIEMHLQWKTDLEEALHGNGCHCMSAHVAAADNQCPLGAWLYGPAVDRFRMLPEFGDLLAVHADFHLTAGRIVAELERGKRKTAEKLTATELQQKSDVVKFALVRLYATCGERATSVSTET